jgi:hypothetical protein
MFSNFSKLFKTFENCFFSLYFQYLTRNFLIYFKIKLNQIHNLESTQFNVKCKSRLPTHFPWEISKMPKFNLTAENFPKTTHEDEEENVSVGHKRQRRIETVSILLVFFINFVLISLLNVLNVAVAATISIFIFLPPKLVKSSRENPGSTKPYRTAQNSNLSSFSFTF